MQRSVIAKDIRINTMLYKERIKLSEVNKAAVRRFFEEIWSKGNFGVADELVGKPGSGPVERFGGFNDNLMLFHQLGAVTLPAQSRPF